MKPFGTCKVARRTCQVATQKQLKHPNIVKLHEHFEETVVCCLMALQDKWRHQTWHLYEDTEWIWNVTWILRLNFLRLCPVLVRAIPGWGICLLAAGVCHRLSTKTASSRKTCEKVLRSKATGSSTKVEQPVMLKNTNWGSWRWISESLKYAQQCGLHWYCYIHTYLYTIYILYYIYIYYIPHQSIISGRALNETYYKTERLLTAPSTARSAHSIVWHTRRPASKKQTWYTDVYRAFAVSGWNGFLQPVEKSAFCRLLAGSIDLRWRLGGFSAFAQAWHSRCSVDAAVERPAHFLELWCFELVWSRRF